MNEEQREELFNQIYDRYHSAVFAYLLAHSGDRETAKDLLQEAFLRVWNRVHIFAELEWHESRHWIYRVAKNLVIDHYRRQSAGTRTREKLMADAAQTLAIRSAADMYEIKERWRAVEQAIGRLPDDLRQVLVLQSVGRMNSTEIGEWLELPPGTVRYRLSMARKRLRQALAHAQGEGSDQ